MQRVSALLPTWDRSNRTSAGSGKTSLDKVRGWADKIPAPANRLSTSSRIGRETYWPATLDKESDRAARILRSFCCAGFLVPDDRPSSPSTTSSSHSTNRVLKKIPPRIIQDAVGLAVFTSMRSGLWTSGSGGSGILIARKADGTWSPPSGLMLQTATLGFVLGADIYDCIVVINSFTTLEVFGRSRVTLGWDVRMTGGPLVSLGLLENELGSIDLSDTVFTYVKSRGQAADVKLDGTILTERADENDRFYGYNLSVSKILAGEINQSLPQVRPLTEVLKAAEGRTDYDAGLLEQLATQPTPGDASIESPVSASSISPSFGLPDVDDPDPFGVLALGLAGLEIREAGSRARPDSSQFEYCPSPSSSVFPKVSRQSLDTHMSRSNRGSYTSHRTTATERSHMTDAITQPDQPNTPETTPSPGQSEDGHQQPKEDIPEVKEHEEVDYTKIDISAIRNLTAFPDLDDDPITIASADDETIRVDELLNPEVVIENEAKAQLVADADDEDDTDHDNVEGSDDDEEFEDAEEPIVYEVATAQPPRMAIVASQAVQMKGAVVNIPRRVPPPLPVRSPARVSRRSKTEFGDVSMISSPLRNEFDLPPQADEATTPRPGETFSTPKMEETTPPTLDGLSPGSKEVKASARPTTPTQETVDYFTMAHGQENEASTAAARTSSNADDGVPVSVA